VTVEFAVDLGRGLRWAKPTSPCLWPSMKAVKVKIIPLSKGQ